MRSLADSRAILGIDPSKRGLAFAYFEGGRLRDWGTRRVSESEIAVFERILDLCPAELLVLEDPEASGCERRPQMRTMLARLARSARARGIGVVKVSRLEVRREWERRGITRKHAVAMAIAEDFPALGPLVPRPRKPYMDEEARVQVFDAASLVLQAFGTLLSSRAVA
jgi:hypothetical protein